MCWGLPAITSRGSTPDGSLDQLFDPSADGDVKAIAVHPDGNIYVSGDFRQIGQAPRRYVARLNGTYGGALSFNEANPNGDVNAIAIQSDGKILLGGAFSNIGGQTRNKLARLDPVSGMADAFDPNTDGVIHTLAIEADGKILAGGKFRSIGGAMRNHFARLDPISGLADCFNPSADDVVYALAVQGDGKVMVGGDFCTSVAKRGATSHDWMEQPAESTRSIRTRTERSVRSRSRPMGRWSQAAISPASADRAATTSRGSMA